MEKGWGEAQSEGPGTHPNRIANVNGQGNTQQTNQQTDQHLSQKPIPGRFPAPKTGLKPKRPLPHLHRCVCHVHWFHRARERERPLIE